jgi:hypothetical protein
VVRAFDDVADELPHGERRLAMAAAVLQRDGLALDGAVKQHRLVDDDPAQHVAADLVIPRGDVPGITHEHERPPFSPA